MTQKDRERLVLLVAKCREACANPARQSIDIWRGDMRAIIAAYRQLQKGESPSKEPTR